LARFKTLVALDLGRTRLTDAHLRQMPGLKSLNVLNLAGRR